MHFHLLVPDGVFVDDEDRLAFALHPVPTPAPTWWRSPIGDPALRLVEVYQTLNGLPALVTTAQEDERRVLPPFEMEISLEGWWLPGPAPTE